jgi:hypothetical protein
LGLGYECLICNMKAAQTRFMVLGWLGFFLLFTENLYAQWPQGKYWVGSPFEWSLPQSEVSGMGMSWWSLDPVNHQLQGFFEVSPASNATFSALEPQRPQQVPPASTACQWHGFSMTAPGTFQPEQHPMINVPFSLPFLLQTPQGDVAVLLEARYQNSTRFMDALPFVLSFSFDWEVITAGFPECFQTSLETQRMEVRLPSVFLNIP